MKNILVAINVAKNAERLLAKAEEFAKAFDSKIWILHVSEPDPDDYLGLEAGPQYAQDKRVENRKKDEVLVKSLAGSLAKKNIAAEGLLLKGSTAKIIKQEVRDLNVDLVIAGHHRRNFFYQIFVGNIEQDIMQDLNVPVLLIPISDK